jgi:hypothetical protein
MAVTEWEFPRPVADMCADLAGQGFDVLSEQRGAGGLLLELQGSVNASGQWQESFVRISADAGHWSISVRFEGMTRWIWAQAWEAYLDGTELGEPDLGRQATFVRHRLPEAALILRAKPGAVHELVRLTDSYLRRRLGLPQT